MERAKTQIISTYENEIGDKSVLTVYCTEDGRTGAVVAFPWATKVFPPKDGGPESEDIISRLLGAEASLEPQALLEAITLHRLLRNPTCDSAEMFSDARNGACGILNGIVDLLESANLRSGNADKQGNIPF